jgi:hypothetical protein
MPNLLTTQPDTAKPPIVYQIRIDGHLGPEWTDWFGGLAITLEDNGGTLLTGPLPDQAALHGLLKKVRDLGMPLVSVNPVQCNATYPDRSIKGEKMKTIKKSPPETGRTNAAIVGVLFIIGTVSGVTGAAMVHPILDAPDYLLEISSHESQIIIATLLQFIMGAACAGIGLALYPILKKYHEGLAIGAVGFRVIEGVLDMIAAVGLIALLALSQEFVKAGAPQASYFQTTGVLINAATGWLNNVAVLLSWCIGALMYYVVFYQYELVPRWLSVWGLIGITLTMLTCLLAMFHLIPGFGTIQVVANLPIALQEMVFAVWLIAKGANPPAAVSWSARAALN